MSHFLGFEVTAYRGSTNNLGHFPPTVRAYQFKNIFLTTLTHEINAVGN